MHLINNKLASYISNSTLPTYYSFINSLFSSNIKQICEVIIVLEGKNALYVHISGSLSINENECLLNIIDITENKRIENNLKESEEKYRVLVDNTDTGFVRIDEQGIVISANEPYKKLAGLKVGDYIIGRSILEWIAPDEIENNSNAVRQCALRGFVIDFETIYQHNDGKRLNIKVNASVYKSNEGQNQIVSYCKDITESKQAEEEIFLSRNYLDMIINSVASPIFVKDENHNFTLVNDAFCLLLNLPKENLIGIPSSEYFLNNDFNSFIAKDITIFKTGKEDVSIEILKDSKGKQRSFFTRKTLHTDILGNKFLVGVLNDITELKNTEESLQKETSKLKQTLSFFNNREEQMVKLKKEVNELLIEAGRDKKYMW